MEGLTDIKPELEPVMPEWVRKIASEAVFVGMADKGKEDFIPTGSIPEEDLPF